MKLNIKQKIIGTMFGCIFMFISFSPRLTWLTAACLLSACLLFIAALSDRP